MQRSELEAHVKKKYNFSVFTKRTAVNNGFIANKNVFIILMLQENKILLFCIVLEEANLKAMKN